MVYICWKVSKLGQKAFLAVVIMFNGFYGIKDDITTIITVEMRLPRSRPSLYCLHN